MTSKILSRDQYTVGWICALSEELTVAQMMLDEQHGTTIAGKIIYYLGAMCEYNVVIAVLSTTGSVSATYVATNMLNEFKSIKFGLMVGVGGGVPTSAADIQLGDVVISKPGGPLGCVVQFYLGTSDPGEFRRTGSLNEPPHVLLQAIRGLKARHLGDGYGFKAHLQEVTKHRNFKRPLPEKDILFSSEYDHNDHLESFGCGNCDSSKIQKRRRDDGDVEVHYGTIASSNQVMRNDQVRDKISKELGSALCFEMEAAGLMNTFPCIVIRGICDYAESHKNDTWKNYAAASAAAYAKELISVIPQEELKGMGDAQLVVDRPGSAEFMPMLFKHAYNFEDIKSRIPRRVEGTCEWFINHKSFIRWRHSGTTGTSGVLYMTAGPGCGKSVLAKHLIEKVLPDVKTTLCYFFFRDLDKQQCPIRAVCSLLYQVLEAHREGLSTEIVQAYKDKQEKFFDSFAQLWRIFAEVTQNLNIMCVIDALDECLDEGRRSFIESMSSLYVCDAGGQMKHANFKFLITCRPYSHIIGPLRSEFDMVNPIHISGDSEENSELIAQEIQIALKYRIDNAAKELNLERMKVVLFEKALSAMRDRTCLWISLIFDGLLDIGIAPTKSEIDKIIRVPPQNIYAAYERILERTRKPGRAMKLLHLIVTATRPLELYEVATALACTHHHSNTALSERIISQDLNQINEHLRNLCGFFTTVVSGKICLLHQTAREFLITGSDAEVDDPKGDDSDFSDMFDRDSPWQGSIPLDRAHKTLATACITFLSSSDSRGQYPAWDKYAMRNWACHYRLASKKCQQRLCLAAMSLCRQPDLLSPTAKHYGTIASRAGDNKAGLHLVAAAAEGLELVVRQILEDEFTLTIDSDTMTAGLDWLGTKISRKQYWLKDSTISKTAYRLGQALLAAAESGHKSVVELLLKHGAQPDSEDGRRMTPPLYAAWEGHESIFELLINIRGVNINHAQENGYTVLCYAAWHNNKAIAKLLLGTGKVDINQSDDHKSRALGIAAGEGHEDMVRLLLETNEIKDIDHLDGDGDSALCLAVKRGHRGVSRLLREYGAKIETRQEPAYRCNCWLCEGEWPD